MAVSCFGAPLAARAAAPSVFISEVAWAGSSRSQADEWIEFAHAGSTPVSLAGWTLEGALTGGETFAFPEDAVIQPSGTYVLSNYQAGHANSVLAQPADFVTTAVSLSNSQLGLVLRLPDGTVVDQAGSGSAPPAGSSALPASMMRVNASLPGEEKASWTTSELAAGLLADVPDIATPGFHELPADTTPEEVPAEEPAEEERPGEDPADVTETVDESETETPPEEHDEVTVTVCNPIPAAGGETPPAGETPEPTTTATEDDAPAMPTYAPGTLVINELLPDPGPGLDEWVEIRNPHAAPIPLAGWMLRDASGKTTALPAQTLDAGAFILLFNPAGNLNNDKDTIELLAPNGSVIDVVSYGLTAETKTKRGWSLIRLSDGDWARTDTPTPGAANAAVPEEAADENTPAQETDASPTDTEDPPDQPVPASDDTPADDAATETSSTNQDDEPAAIALPRFRLSELYPNTGGQDLTDEFIEIVNEGDEPADLKGWKIGDLSKTVYTHAVSTILAPGEAVALPRPTTKIALNNEGDTVRLMAPDNTTVDEVTYGKTQKELAYAKGPDGWAWTTARTPDEPNVIQAPAGKTTAKAAAPAPAHLTVAQMLEREDGLAVAFEGVVTLVSSSKVAYVRDATGGIRLDGANAFTFKAGDRVSLTGTLGQAYGERRIRVAAKDLLQVRETEAAAETDGALLPAAPRATDAASIAEEDVGDLVAFEGFLVAKSGASLRVEADGVEYAVRMGAGMSSAGIKVGSRVRVSGTAVLRDGMPALVGSSIELAPEEPAEADVEPSAPTHDAETGALLSLLQSLLALVRRLIGLV